MEKWGASDPYYGVLGYSTQSVADPDVHRAFLATGRDDLGRRPGRPAACRSVRVVVP
jgi:hypothetical protein